MSQFELPAKPDMQVIDPALVARQPTMTAARKLCQTLSGFDDKAFTGKDGIVNDVAQWSRIMGAGQHHFPQDALNTFMDLAGNEAPLLWLAHSRGYDITSLRKLETETERRLRETEEKLAQALMEKRVLVEALNGRVAA